MTDKSPNLTDTQNDICFEIKFTLVRAIINLNHDDMWKLIGKAIEEEKRKEVQDADCD